jgi:hypothetical protein
MIQERVSVTRRDGSENPHQHITVHAPTCAALRPLLRTAPCITNWFLLFSIVNTQAATAVAYKHT